MKKLIYTIIINALALFASSYVLEGFSFEGGWVAPVIFAAVLIVLNALIKPILKFVSFPLVFLTGGLFLIVVNAVMLYLAEYVLVVMDVSGVAVHFESLLTYVFAAIIFGVANWLIHWFLKD